MNEQSRQKLIWLGGSISLPFCHRYIAMAFGVFEIISLSISLVSLLKSIHKWIQFKEQSREMIHFVECIACITQQYDTQSMRESSERKNEISNEKNV